MAKWDETAAPAINPRINQVIERVSALGDGLKSVLGVVESTESRVLGTAGAEKDPAEKNSLTPTRVGTLNELSAGLDRLDFLIKRLSESADKLASL